jgi:hypothetical protein
MTFQFHRKRFSSFMITIAILGVLSAGILKVPQAAAQTGAPEPAPTGNQAAPSTGSQVYLPYLFSDHPWVSPFGVEIVSPLDSSSTILDSAKALNASWVRMGTRVSWRTLQPNPGEPIHWELLAGFENELRNLRSAGMSPLVIIYDSPDWATVDKPRNQDYQKSSCAPIRPEMYDEFATFVRSVVNRYKEPEFNVHNWELGNEPDVDPDQVPPNSGFGCWGNIDDKSYFGGKQYGEMLKAVTPTIRAEDPNAKVWLGGLLLAYPEPPNSDSHPSQLFFKGVLESGAAPYFDIVAYHWYPSYWNPDHSTVKVDYDNSPGGVWGELGGVAGKAAFLRQVMKQYNVDKPVVLNEGGFGCPNDWTFYPWCENPDSLFYDTQADYLVRSFVRGLSQGVSGLYWYTMEGPGWRYTGLLDGNQNPKPVYLAYQQLTTRLQGARYLGTASYGSEVEAYAFKKGSRLVHVLWTKTDKSVNVQVPQAKFIEASSREGALLSTSLVGSNLVLPASFSPIYIVLQP